MEKIKLLLADDHKILLEGLHSLLNTKAKIEIMKGAKGDYEAVNRPQELKPDVILLDISLPKLNGSEATKQIKKLFLNCQTLILIMHVDDECLFQAFRVDASGYVLKGSAFQNLISIRKAVNQGETYLDDVISEDIIEKYFNQIRVKWEKPPPDSLSKREKEILRLIVEGLLNKEIADLLHISVRTVEKHRANIMNKTNLHKVIDLVRYAIQTGLIDLDT